MVCRRQLHRDLLVASLPGAELPGASPLAAGLPRAEAPLASSLASGLPGAEPP